MSSSTRLLARQRRALQALLAQQEQWMTRQVRACIPSASAAAFSSSSASSSSPSAAVERPAPCGDARPPPPRASTRSTSSGSRTKGRRARTRPAPSPLLPPSPSAPARGQATAAAPLAGPRDARRPPGGGGAPPPRRAWRCLLGIENAGCTPGRLRAGRRAGVLRTWCTSPLCACWQYSHCTWAARRPRQRQARYSVSAWLDEDSAAAAAYRAAAEQTAPARRPELPSRKIW